MESGNVQEAANRYPTIPNPHIINAEEANKYLDSTKMPSPESLMTDIRDLLFGTRPKSKDVIDKCQEYAEAYHQAKLSELRKKVGKIAELNDEMPDELWEIIKDDKDMVIETMRTVVRETKEEILDLLNQ